MAARSSVSSIRCACLAPVTIFSISCFCLHLGLLIRLIGWLSWKILSLFLLICQLLSFQVIYALLIRRDLLHLVNDAIELPLLVILKCFAALDLQLEQVRRRAR